MRDLTHHLIPVTVYETPEISQTVYFFIDETEPELFEAETRMILFVTPSDLWTDVKEAMIANRIFGRLHPQIDFDLADQTQAIAI